MRPDVPALTGLRGIAAVWVVLFHMHVTNGTDPGLREIVRHGYLAVDLFFVLSGFLMVRAYGGLFSSGVRPAEYRLFLTRRLARVYPLYLLVTLGFIGLSALGYTGSDKQVTPGLVVLNLAMLQTWFTNVSYCIPGWSISTEFAAYLVFPFVILPRFCGSSALCVDCDAAGPMFGAGGSGAHRTGHERSLPHAGLPRRGDHAWRS